MIGEDKMNTAKIISESETYGNLPWQVVIDVYFFAERTGIPRLQSNCLDTVIKKTREAKMALYFLFSFQTNIRLLPSLGRECAAVFYRQSKRRVAFAGNFQGSCIPKEEEGPETVHSDLKPHQDVTKIPVLGD